MTTGKEWLDDPQPTDYIAYILVKVAPGTAPQVADQMVDIGASDTGGVYWAVVLAGPNDILAGVRVLDGSSLVEIVQQIQQIDVGGVKAVTSTLTQVALDYYPVPAGPGVGFP